VLQIVDIGTLGVQDRLQVFCGYVYHKGYEIRMCQGRGICNPLQFKGLVLHLISIADLLFL
jgi:hypothetical protein